MAAITLEQAQEQLSTWLAANLAVSQAQEYKIGSRTLTRANSTEILKQIQYWQLLVNRLDGSFVRVRRVVPRDL